MLLMPYLLGTLVAGWGGWPSFLLLASIVTLFTSSRPLELAIRDGRSAALARFSIYALLGGVAGVLLLIFYHRWMLLPVAAAAGLSLASQLVLRRRHLDRTWPARLVSIAALSAAGPAAYYATTGALDRRAFALWLIAFLYSGASVFYVRLYYRTPQRQKEDGRKQAERQMAAYLDALVATTLVLAVAGWFPPLGTAALIPLAVKVGLAWKRRGSRPSLRRIGVIEMGYSVLFLALATAAFALWT